MTYDYRFRPLATDDNESGDVLVLTQSVLATMNAMLPLQVNGVFHENVLYLAGTIEDFKRTATTVIAPRAKTSPRAYDTDVRSHAAVVDAVGRLDLCVVAQVHCHPGDAVYHSDADDDLAFVRGEGFWSIVVPNYGRKGVLPIDQCGFHCFSGGEFRLLSPRAAKARIQVLPNHVDLRGVL